MSRDQYPVPDSVRNRAGRRRRQRDARARASLPPAFVLDPRPSDDTPGYRPDAEQAVASLPDGEVTMRLE